MATAGKGRHRAPARGPTAALVAGAVVVAIAVVAAVALSAGGGDEPAGDADVGVTSPTPETGVTQLTATRVTDVNNNKVTVREVTVVSSGSGVRVRPSKGRPAPGLVWIGSRIVSEDGTSKPFNASVTLTSGGKLTVEGTYRLSQCPELLPTSWPSPVSLVAGEWDRVFTRVEVPQRTARSLCPQDKSQAKSLRALSGVMVKSQTPVVRLRWQSARPLTILAIGSASEVAARSRQSACGGNCVASVKPRSATRVSIKPLERCAIGGRANELTLAVREQGRQKIVALSIRGLARAVCARKVATD